MLVQFRLIVDADDPDLAMQTVRDHAPWLEHLWHDGDKLEDDETRDEDGWVVLAAIYVRMAAPSLTLGDYSDIGEEAFGDCPAVRDWVVASALEAEVPAPR